MVFLSTVFRPTVVSLYILTAFCASPEVRAYTAENTLEFPGGVQTVANVVGSGSDADRTSGIERVFAAVLQTEPHRAAYVKTNPVREDLISYLNDYDALQEFLKKESLSPADWKPGDSLETAFPLTGSRREIERTRRLLSFFGIRCEPAKAGPDEVEIRCDPHPARRSTLFRALRLVPDGASEIHLSLRSERLPMILDESRWSRILSSHGPGPRMQDFARKPEAMRLYLALQSCSIEARQALADSVDSGQLLRSAEALSLFGASLRFENGQLVFPGSAQAWTGVVGPPARALNNLLSGGGIPLLLYNAVAAAPPEVQRQLTATAETLEDYYRILKPYASGSFPGTVGTAVGEDLPRIFRLLAAGPGGLVFDLDGRFLRAYLRTLDSQAAEGPGPVPASPKLISVLLPRPGISPYATTSRAGTLEFFRHIATAHREWLSEECIELLTKNPEQAPAILDVIGDLAPSPALLSSYLRYCAKIARPDMNGWDQNRARTSQATFFLISLLRREGALSQQQAEEFLAGTLRAFDSENEAAFASETAGFLSAKLIPEIARGNPNSGDALLDALSGLHAPQAVVYRGRRFMLDRSTRNLRRMKDALDTQAHTPLPVLLHIYARLRALPAAGDPEEMRQISEELNLVRTAERIPGLTGQTDGAAQIDVDALKRAVSTGNAKKGRGAPRARADEIAALLHTELGITLLTYCYAYGADPETNVLAFDPNFVRKHRFYPKGSIRSTWLRARYAQDELEGGYMEGSLAGIEFELMRLKMEQSRQDFGTAWDSGLAPSILFGIKRVRPELRTNRAQEYVALATGLGRRLAELPQTSPALNAWIAGTLAPLISARRLEQMRAPSGAAFLSRSELFLLGQAYYAAGEWRSGACPDADLCSAAGRLDEIVPNRESVEYNDFYHEVAQYGVLLHHRIGLSRLSFDGLDSYERLEKGLRAESLYDRICDLKIRIAELNHALGIPAALGEAEASLALQHILEASPASSGSWKHVIAQIDGITRQAAQGWIDELLTRESLSTRLNEIGAPGR